MSSSQANCESYKDRKFGMPEWMVQNIERLNTTTDFEQYAYSPETDGFLAEFSVAHETSEISLSPKITDEKSSLPNSVLEGKAFKQRKGKSDFSDLKLPLTKFDSLQKPLSPRHQSVLDALKCDDAIYSSPDTTPHTTPQPSPAPQRKSSFSSVDNSTVQSNPEKWFYLGGKEKNKIKQLKGKCEPLHLQTVLDAHKKKYDEKHAKGKFSNRDNPKLAISNFDLNAISPSSW